MMNMFYILKNNYYRAVSRKNYFILMLCISMVTITAAVFFTAKFEVKGNIAIVPAHGSSINIDSEYLHVESLKEAPGIAALVMHKYDAVVIDNGNGTYEIRTIKGDDFRSSLESVLNKSGGGFNTEEDRGIASNILGYMMMFVFIQGLLYMMMYSEDREKGTFKRIAVSPVSAGTYLAGHGIFNFLMVFLPVYLLIITAKIIFNIDIGLSYLQYAGLLGVLTLLSTCFSLLMSSVFRKADDSSMFGQLVSVLTSLLAGCFYSFDSTNGIMKRIVVILPQKNFLNLVYGLEGGKSISSFIPQLVYLAVFTVIMAITASGLVKSNLRRGEG